ncbi:MAG TPA: cell division protein FtsL [bacterium]|nr:cell division protein FtsL [bacterium]HPN32028.1 cell division protein FtsL [bacterium]
MKKIKKKGNLKNIRKNAESLYSIFMGKWKTDWKMYSSFILMAITLLALIGYMSFQEEQFTNLKAQIKRLQDKKIGLDNEKKKILLEKVELENPVRIKEIALTKMGLEENRNKKVVVIKVK